MTHDRDIRAALHVRLAPLSAQPNTLVVDELGLLNGAIRADVAVIGEELHGYEIKSEADRMDRLRVQVTAYETACDRATLVCAERHLTLANEIVAPWWGIVIASEHRGAVELTDYRAAQPNPDVHPMAVVRLLWREEMVALLESVNAARGYRSKGCWDLRQRLIDLFPLDELRRHVRRQLRDRTNWRVAA